LSTSSGSAENGVHGALDPSVGRWCGMLHLSPFIGAHVSTMGDTPVAPKAALHLPSLERCLLDEFCVDALSFVTCKGSLAACTADCPLANLRLPEKEMLQLLVYHDVLPLQVARPLEIPLPTVLVSLWFQMYFR
jgi:hypothetical protein